jgi:F-type H+-transporting ATPase subunit b
VSELITSLGIDWNVVIAQAASLLILLALLKFVLYTPFEGMLRQREESIANNLAGAEAQQAKAAAVRREYEGHLATIDDERRERLEQAAKDAEAARQQLLDTAQAEIKALYARHEAQLALEREQLRRALRQEMSDVAVSAATKALRARMTPELQSAVIDQVINEMGQAPLQ